MLILALDTSGRAISVALLEDEKPLAELRLAVDRHHSETLLTAVNQLFCLSGKEVGQLKLLSCTIGPGSFTGLRIAVSTVKGFAFALNIPIAGISTLEALACNQLLGGMPVCPMLDARNNQVYCGLYAFSSGGSPEVIISDRLIDISEIMAEIAAPTIFIGEGALRYQGLLEETLPGKVRFPASNNNWVMAAAVGLLGFRRYQEGKVCNAGSIKPIYIRPQSPARTEPSVIARNVIARSVTPISSIVA